MGITPEAKNKLLSDLKAGAVNVIAMRPIAIPAEQVLFDRIMGQLRSGMSWLSMVTGPKKAIFYVWPLAERMARDYDDLIQLIATTQGYNTLHAEPLGLMAEVLQAAEVLLQERQILLLFDYSDAPGGGRIVTFYIVPMEGFEAHDPGFVKVMKKLEEADGC